MSYLKDIAVFVRVVQLKGFAAAGRDLGLTAPSVSKQIARLEAELGVTLLHRTTHSLFLTDAGNEFYERCVRGLAEIEEARVAATSFNDELKGKLRVHATLSVGQALIAPAITSFMARHPEIRVELEMGSVPVNPMEQHFDIAIRTKTSRETSPGHVSIGRRVLGRVHQLVVASPAYLSRLGTPASIDKLLEHRCLVYVTQTTSSENWLFQNGRADQTIRVDPVLRSNNWLAIKDAAVLGLGIARLPDFTVRADVASGRLVSLFEDQTRSDLQVQALFPRTQRMPAKMRQLLDFLAARLGPAPEAGKLRAEGVATREPPQPATPLANAPAAVDSSLPHKGPGSAEGNGKGDHAEDRRVADRTGARARPDRRARPV